VVEIEELVILLKSNCINNAALAGIDITNNATDHNRAFFMEKAIGF
jgi:hypothetical protein